MSDRHAIQIRWDFRAKRYVARCARYPALIAYGATRYFAERHMKEAIAKHILGERDES